MEAKQESTTHFHMFYLTLTAHADHCNTKDKVTTQTRPVHDLSDVLSQVPVQLNNPYASHITDANASYSNKLDNYLNILVSTIKSSKNPVLGR